MEQEKARPDVPPSQGVDPNDGGNLIKNAKRTLGIGNDANKELDDEMQRPPEDRSPLT